MVMNASVKNVQTTYLNTRPGNCYPFVWCIKNKTVNKFSLNIYIYICIPVWNPQLCKMKPDMTFMQTQKLFT